MDREPLLFPTETVPMATPKKTQKKNNRSRFWAFIIVIVIAFSLLLFLRTSTTSSTAGHTCGPHTELIGNECVGEDTTALIAAEQAAVSDKLAAIAAKDTAEAAKDAAVTDKLAAIAAKDAAEAARDAAIAEKEAAAIAKDAAEVAKSTALITKTAAEDARDAAQAAKDAAEAARDECLAASEPPYQPCAQKSEGDDCLLCAPGDSECAETMVVKTCQDVGSSNLVCSPLSSGSDDTTSQTGPCDVGTTTLDDLYNLNIPYSADPNTCVKVTIEQSIPVMELTSEDESACDAANNADKYFVTAFKDTGAYGNFRITTTSFTDYLNPLALEAGELFGKITGWGVEYTQRVVGLRWNNGAKYIHLHVSTTAQPYDLLSGENSAGDYRFGYTAEVSVSPTCGDDSGDSGGVAFKPADSAALKTAVNECLQGNPDGSCTSNGAIGDWDVSLVTNMDNLFDGKAVFNQDLSKWDTSSVTSMNFMFGGCSVFNQDLSKWDTGAVTSMSYTFLNAYVFNQDLSSWDTSKVTTFKNMFFASYVFNQDLSKWDTGAVTSMSHMFFRASAFNSDVSAWDTSKVTTMKAMFKDSGYAGTFCGGTWESLSGANSAFTDLGSSTARIQCPTTEFGMAPCKALLNNCGNYECGGECGTASNNMKMIPITRCGDIFISGDDTVHPQCVDVVGCHPGNHAGNVGTREPDGWECLGSNDGVNWSREFGPWSPVVDASEHVSVGNWVPTYIWDSAPTGESLDQCKASCQNKQGCNAYIYGTDKSCTLFPQEYQDCVDDQSCTIFNSASYDWYNLSGDGETTGTCDQVSCTSLDFGVPGTWANTGGDGNDQMACCYMTAISMCDDFQCHAFPNDWIVLTGVTAVPATHARCCRAFDQAIDG